jgi:hypothetical protein
LVEAVLIIEVKELEFLCSLLLQWLVVDLLEVELVLVLLLKMLLELLE